MNAYINKFVTAKTKEDIGPRHRRLIDFNIHGDYVIKGETGDYYICYGQPIIVTNPPKRTV